jgi:hypothetical protein
MKLDAMIWSLTNTRIGRIEEVNKVPVLAHGIHRDVFRIVEHVSLRTIVRDVVQLKWPERHEHKIDEAIRIRNYVFNSAERGVVVDCGLKVYTVTSGRRDLGNRWGQLTHGFRFLVWTVVQAKVPFNDHIIGSVIH